MARRVRMNIVFVGFGEGWESPCAGDHHLQGVH